MVRAHSMGEYQSSPTIKFMNEYQKLPPQKLKLGIVEHFVIFIQLILPLRYSNSN